MATSGGAEVGARSGGLFDDGAPPGSPSAGPGGPGAWVRRIVARWRGWFVRQRGDASWWFALPLYLVLIVALVDSVLPGLRGFPPFGNDAWTYYELSRGFPFDPGHQQTFRWFGSTEPYTSVPPLWPAFLAITDVATGTGYRGALIANPVAMVVAAVALDRAGRRWFGFRGWGPAVVLGFLLFSWFRMQIPGGGSLPATIACLCLLLAAVSNPWPLNRRAVTWAALAMAAFTLVRFDALLLVVFFPLALVGLGALERRGLVRFYGVFLLGVSPWIVYSIVHFRTLFVTVYSGSALTAGVTTPVDYHETPPPTIFQAPDVFFDKVQEGLPLLRARLLGSITDAVILRPLAIFALLVAGVVAAAAVHRARRQGEGGLQAFSTGVRGTWRRLVDSRAIPVLFVLLVLSSLVMTVSQLTGYAFDPRYWSVPFFLVECVLTAVVVVLVPRRRVLAVAATAVFVFLGIVPSLHMRGMITMTDQVMVWESWGDPVERVVPLATCAAPDDRVLFLEGTTIGYMYGALTDGTAVAQPLNWSSLTPDERVSFMRKYGVTHAYIEPRTSDEALVDLPERFKRSNAGTTLEPICTRGLYRVALPEPR